MSLTDYFFKSDGITLFDTLLIAVLSVFIVTLLKQTSIMIWKALVSIFNFTIKIFTIKIPNFIKKLKKKHHYNQNLKSGDISLMLYVSLTKKNDEGTISKLEKKALNANHDKYQQTYDAFKGLDLKKLIGEKYNFPKV